eukprot:COSAG02_NODE_10845_length_1847_cov_1.481693_2_plen_89_part_01
MGRCCCCCVCAPAGEPKALLAALVLVVAAGGGKAQKPQTPPCMDDQDTALHTLQLLSNPDTFYGWFGSSPADGGQLAEYLGGQPERNPT